MTHLVNKLLKITSMVHIKMKKKKTVVRAWDQEVCSFCGLRFKFCGCSYDGHWRLTWSLTSRPVGLVEVRASWPDTHIKLKKMKKNKMMLMFSHQMNMFIKSTLPIYYLNEIKKLSVNT